MLTRLIAAIRQRLRGPTLEEEMRALQHRLTRNERRLRRLEAIQEELSRRGTSSLRSASRRRRSRGETTGGLTIPLM